MSTSAAVSAEMFSGRGETRGLWAGVREMGLGMRGREEERMRRREDEREGEERERVCGLCSTVCVFTRLCARAFSVLF